MNEIALLWTGIGYVCGSILFANVFAYLFHQDIVSTSVDHNPGAVNAFRYGGKWIGVLTLIGDLGKGWFPVFCYHYLLQEPVSWWLALVMVAPLVGHAWPILTKFHGGGKGVAVTFGILLGLLPTWQPVVLLAVVFVFFSTLVRIRPDYLLTGVSYLVTAVLIALLTTTPILLGFSLMTSVVLARLFFSKEPRTKMEVKIGWKH